MPGIMHDPYRICYKDTCTHQCLLANSYGPESKPACLKHNLSEQWTKYIIHTVVRYTTQ